MSATQARYTVLDLTSLRTRARYDRGVQYSTPVALVVVDAAGAAHRAEYVDNSLLALGRAVYRVAGAEFELRPSGALSGLETRGCPKFLMYGSIGDATAAACVLNMQDSALRQERMRLE